MHDAVEDKISRIERRRADGEAQTDLEQITGKPEQPPHRAGLSRTDKQRQDIAGGMGGIAADRLLSIIERVERLEEERKALADDIKDIFAESKSAGFDNKIIKQIMKIRKMEPEEAEEQETLLDVYKRALGMGV